MSKKVIVLFSGGLDSTYLIWKNLKEENVVKPLYFEIENNVNKALVEKQQIKLLWNLFHDEFKDNIKPIEYTIKIDIDQNGTNELTFEQVPIWLLGILFSIDRNYDEVQIAYVGNDDAISYLKEIKKIYKSYQDITHKLIPLKFPLRKIFKYKILNELPIIYRDLTFSCENPKIISNVNNDVMFEPCGCCIPCKKIIMSNNFNLGLDEKYNKIRNEYITKEYNHINNIPSDNELKAESKNPSTQQLYINF